MGVSSAIPVSHDVRSHVNPYIQKLNSIRAASGKPQTTGLKTETVEQLLSKDPKLAKAIDQAYEEFQNLKGEFESLLKLPEADLIQELQKDYINFYSDDSVNPYVALSGAGPWIVTTTGAVLYDAGGYGMLGFGHAPEAVLKAMARKHVMANIMTPSFSQKKFTSKLFQQIGFSRPADKRKPFARFLCLNSGSEAMTVAARISDINARLLTAAGKKHAGKKIKFLALKGGFHGRTDRPAQASDSSLPKYREHLASFQNRDNLVTVTPNDVHALKAAFAAAQKDNVFFEMMFIEPVMGEGNPGEAMSVEFYQAARALTAAEGTLLVCDSIQASIRAHGCLSMCDYPGFQDLEAPDMETYSKAINAGQYPLSVLAMREQTAKLYVKGVYGNTMTTNPRALDVAVAVLELITPELRKNVQERGKEFVQKLKALQKEFPTIIEDVKGTGLLVSAAINPQKHKVVGVNCLEDTMRKHGVNVIHGGTNSLRFTPHFWMTSHEVDLIIETLKNLIK